MRTRFSGNFRPGQQCGAVGNVNPFRLDLQAAQLRQRRGKTLPLLIGLGGHQILRRGKVGKEPFHLQPFELAVMVHEGRHAVAAAGPAAPVRNRPSGEIQWAGRSGARIPRRCQAAWWRKSRASIGTQSGGPGRSCKARRAKGWAAAIPAARNSSASSTVATPNQSTPHSARHLETGTAPWP